MTTEEFLQEAIAYPQCPDDFKETYREFQTYQAATLRTLVEFHRVCEKNGVDYQLAYGSLLGVVRDGGQIPWDYDIDVLVPYSEKKKLLAALEKDLKPEFYYYCPENNSGCRHMIMRLAPREFRTEALHVDVFYLIGAPDDEAERKAFAGKVASVSDLRYGKLVNLREESLGRPRRFASLLIKKKIPALFCSMNSLQRRYDALVQKYPADQAKILVTADTYAGWKDYPAELMRDTEILETNFGPIRVPVRREELLALLYGEFRTVPPIERRIHEVEYHTGRIRRFQKAGSR